ncbi:MAG: FAD-binding oxidoreductase, partial [Candidatus Eremiobacteraeota bacterium]|nr:FAD-binding oxidoreductase [Candidatus Eremiobacteraeota bacterium]
MSEPLAIAGVAPRHVVTPRSLDELARSIHELAAQRRPFAVVGGGTQLELGNAPRALDTVVRTFALDRVVDYAPEDQTISVEAGMTFEELDRILARNGQMLPLDVTDRRAGTVGGAVATNAYGRRRLRYGTAKDLIVGVGIVRPDGVRARGGGKVVKNVAGFDLPKLMVGSLGSLGAIATVTFRVYPIPEAVRAVAFRFDSAAGIDVVLRELLARRLEPESVALYNYATLVVTFAGTRPGVDAQASVLTGEIARLCGTRADELGELETESYAQRERAVRRDGDWRLRIVAPPANPVATLGSFVASAPLAVPVAYPTLGVALHAYGPPALPPASGDPRPDWHLADLRERVATHTQGSGHVVVHAMPLAARGIVDAWSAHPPALPLMRALKERF